MTYENIKSIILTILIVMSIYLTWSIWTYQPKNELMDDPSFVPSVEISESREINQVIKPVQIYYHHDNEHYGTTQISEIDRIIKEISTWSFAELEDVTNQTGNLSEFIYEKGHAQIVFPDLVPMEVYKNVLGIKDENTASVTFDQIIIDLNNINKQNGNVYFVSTTDHRVFRTSVTASFITNFKEDYFEKGSANKYFAPYALETVSENHKLLVLSEPVTINAYNYLLDVIETTKFRDALFRNPDPVRRNSTDAGEEYKDSSTLLSVNMKTNTLLYVDTTQEKDVTIDSSHLLQQSIDFVNGHKGWTDNYYFVGIDELEQTVSFRIYDSAGHPIFSDNGMSEILQIWGKTSIYQYLRNNFILDNQPVESSAVELMSGVDTLKRLKERENIEPEFIQELVLGYEMKRTNGDPLIHLEPSWYYKYKDQWWNMNSGEEGLEFGLE
ncbi:hypothetical protein EKG37_22820 [Robertmurraya yapensis]|uniref:Regulatory protein YycH domain-containing protein n=2 Tax=Bacillaceae TaxID=186817 RepID=A0A3S0K9C8_9BACI|nr:two-component system activity regulator YycH [Bacillus yapensis]RTR25569.1 hypothetical protein EKG37_22820 [Bacillus yapensis]TKS93432.1 hypothetical protein FAR12_22825 [Bacillus yapensis]